jgi:2-aminoethylphosphonate-pyruvate transaminase
LKEQKKMKEYLLFTPGPVNVAESVRQAIAKSDICHREIDFDTLLESVEAKLLELFQLKNNSGYRAVVISGSGTAANEAVLSSVVGDQNILVLSNGEFGERLHAISKIHNKNTHLLEFPWGEGLDLADIERYLESHDIDIVAMVHHETSSGMLNCLEKVGALSKAHGAMFVVDCVSSVGAEVIDMEKCGIAFCSGSSSKAIGSHAGLSFVIGKKQEFEKLGSLPAKTAYLNLAAFYHFLKTRSQTPNTPAVPLFFALEQSLINILDEGVARRYASLRHKARLLRQGMQRLGLKFLIDQKDMCSVLTTVHLPSHIDVTDFRQKLREQSIIIYEGKGCFKNKVFQVGNIGELSVGDIQFFLTTLGNALRSFEAVKTQTIVSFGDYNPTFRPLSEPLSSGAF